MTRARPTFQPLGRLYRTGTYETDLANFPTKRDGSQGPAGPSKSLITGEIQNPPVPETKKTPLIPVQSPWRVRSKLRIQTRRTITPLTEWIETYKRDYEAKKDRYYTYDPNECCTQRNDVENSQFPGNAVVWDIDVNTCVIFQETESHPHTTVGMWYVCDVGCRDDEFTAPTEKRVAYEIKEAAIDAQDEAEIG